MGVTEWQRQLLATLTRLEDGQRGLTGEVAGMRGDIAEMRGDIGRLTDGQQEIRDDVRMLTRVVVRRFGSAGSPAPQIGDHVVYHVGVDTVLPAVVVQAHGERLDLEVFGAELTAPHRFPRDVPPGEGPGCWRLT